MFNFRNKKPKVNKNIVKSRKEVVKIRNQNKKELKSVERVLPNMNLVYLVTLLLILGLLMIFSSSAFYAYRKYDDTFFFFKRQVIYIIVGIILGGSCYFMPLDMLKRMSVPILIVGLLMLIYMLPEALFGAQMPLVKTINGATRWLDFKFFDFQPAEFIKFAFLLYLSAWLSKTKEVIKKLKDPGRDYLVNILLPFLLLLGAISFLILAQSDLDTTVIIALTILAVYYVSGDDKLHNMTTIAILVFAVLFGLGAMLGEDYRRARVESYWEIMFHGEPRDPKDTSFQVWSGIVAIGSGKIFGQGYGESHLKLGYLNEAAYTDSIFAVIGEEFGLVGAVFVIIGFLYFTSIGLNIANRAPDKFSSLLAIGMTFWISIQAFLNIAANLSVIPFGGMPLPFFTYGGSNTIMIIIAVGVLLNISREGNRISGSERVLEKFAKE